MQRIFLIGYMGAGKTTIGEKLSVQMGLSFIDLDHFIEKRYHKTIRQIFEEKGEESFRETEKKALREVAEFEDAVISTGGGTPCFHENMAFMNSAGTTVYLKASVDELARRMEGSNNTRPVLENRSGEALRQFMEASLSERSRHYEQAKIIFNVEFMDTETDLEGFVGQLEKIISS
ncbi:MAG: shikimate kinase [Tannerella sp.]|jgi:shikimate kinase|nr:shikimate kinase [Tannerella sp.]